MTFLVRFEVHHPDTIFQRLPQLLSVHAGVLRVYPEADGDLGHEAGPGSQPRAARVPRLDPAVPVTAAARAAGVVADAGAAVTRHPAPLTPPTGHTSAPGGRAILEVHVRHHLLPGLDPPHLLTLGRPPARGVTEAPGVKGVVLRDAVAHTDAVQLSQ